MKIVLAIFCSGLLLGGQLAMAAPAVGAGQPMHHCHCGGKMPCCAAGKASAPQPVTATVQTGSQNQILPPAPALVVWVLATAETAAIFPAAAASLPAGATPLFARNCVRLI